jgi:hypothetical protein
LTVQTPEEIGRDLPADLSDSERESLVAAGMRLQAVRPRPLDPFKRSLRLRLLGSGPSAS